MPITLLVITVVVNGLALLYALLVQGREGWREGRALFAGAKGRLLFAAVIGIFLMPFLLTLPSHPPFSPGLGLGWGILIGGVLGILVLFASPVITAQGKTVAVAPLSAAGLSTAFALLLFRADPTDTLIGCALGAVAVALVGSGLLRTFFAGTRLQSARSLELYGISASAVAAAVRLGMEHFPGNSTDSVVGYWVLPALLLGAGALTLVVVSAAQNDLFTHRLPWLPGAIAAAVILLVTIALRVKLLPQVSWSVLLFGLLAMGITQALLLQEERAVPPTSFRPLGITFGLLLVILAVVGLAFRQMQGYGEALALLPVLFIAGSLYTRRDMDEYPLTASLGVAALSLFLLFTLSRLVLQDVGSAHMLDFQRQYDLFTLVLGAGVTLGIVTVLQQWGRRITPPLPAVFQLLALAILVMAAPLAALVLFGAKALLAFIMGLALGVIIWMALAAWIAGDERSSVLSSAPQSALFLSILAAIQLAPKILAVNISFAHRLTVVLIFSGIIVLWIVVDAVSRVRQSKGGTDHALA